jgi:hypothetical protein
VVVVLPVVPGELDVDKEPAVEGGVAELEVKEGPEPPLVPVGGWGLEVGRGTTVTATLTSAPVVVLIRVRVRFDELAPVGLVTGKIATVELPSEARTDGSLTTSMLPDRFGPVEGGTG